MNIFVTHHNPVIAAGWLDDVRANKMLLENCQMMCTAIREVHPAWAEDNKIYKSYNPGQKCNIWVRSSRKRFEWVLNNSAALSARLKADHRCNPMLAKCAGWYKDHRYHLPDDDLTPFLNAAKDEKRQLDYTNMKETIFAYRLYMAAKWRTDEQPPTWRTGFEPDWREA